jgi:hypothetical protein
LIRPLTPEDAARVAANMRDIDRREICALHATDDPVAATSALAVFPHIGGSVWRGDEPICVVGAIWLWPGVVSVFMFATDRWPEVALEATKFVRRVLLPALRDAGVHRLQCHSLAEHTDAHAWLRFLGADREVPEPEYGKNREDYVLFSMSRAALERVTSVEK